MTVTVQSYCASYLEDLHAGVHDWYNDDFKLAIYTSTSNINRDTTVYTSDDEVSSAGYSAGGVALPVAEGYPKSVERGGGVEIQIDFDDISLVGVTFTMRYALIYNATKSNRAVAVLDFQQDYYVQAGLQIIWPDPITQYPLVRLGA